VLPPNNATATGTNVEGRARHRRTAQKDPFSLLLGAALTLTLTGLTRSRKRHLWIQFKKQDAANNNGKRTTAIRNAWGPHHSTPLACQTEAIETTGNTAPYNPWTNKNNPGTKVVVVQFLKLKWC
jgi:hypothetical protein